MPEDLGQKELQDRADRIEALGYVPSDGASLGLEEDVSPEELAEGQKQANKEHMMPPFGNAAEKPERSVEATSPEGESPEDTRPAKSASREEWDEYARSQGVDPEEFSSKDDLIAHFDQS